MLSAIGSYINRLSVYMIISFLINIFVPDEGYKKHIYFFMGILIITGVISPLCKIIQGEEINFSPQIKYAEEEAETIIQNNNAIITNKFKADVEQAIKEQYGTEYVNISVGTKEGSIVIESIEYRGTMNTVDVSCTYGVPLENIHLLGDEGS